MKHTILFTLIFIGALVVNTTVCLWLFGHHQWSSSVVVPLMFLSSGISAGIIVWSAYRLG